MVCLSFPLCIMNYLLQRTHCLYRTKLSLFSDKLPLKKNGSAHDARIERKRQAEAAKRESARTKRDAPRLPERRSGVPVAVIPNL